MSVYRRYFKVESGPLIDAVAEAQKTNTKARSDYEKILADIPGAKASQWYQDEGRLVGIIFEETPDRYLFKKACNGKAWMPKKNTKQAKAIAEKFAEVKTVNIPDLLKLVGLGRIFWLCRGGRVYSCGLTDIPSEPPVVYISVPWYDEDPKVVEEYKAKENCHNSELDAILWEPTLDMKEVKKWEVDRDIDQWNESVKAEKKAA